MSLVRTLFFKISNLWVRRSCSSLTNFYRSKGVTIGKGCIFRYPGSVEIDLMRPSLISIGDNVDMNRHFTILTHDFSHRVFFPIFNEMLSSSGPVSIGNNVYFGTNVTILKNVTIGDNCIIGAGSIVSKDIPSNSVAVGVPCKVICSLDEFYNKRKNLWRDEAIVYANIIRDKYKREPTIDEFWPEFGLFVDSHNIDQYNINPIKLRLGDRFEIWLKNHKAYYDGFDDFLEKSKTQ